MTALARYVARWRGEVAPHRPAPPPRPEVADVAGSHV